MNDYDLTDSHAHLTFDKNIGLEALLERARAAHVSRIVNICTDPQSLEAGLLLEKRYPWIRNAGATTPDDVEREGESAFAFFAEAARQRRLAAIGETGLDYHHRSDRSAQKIFFVRYLHLAAECKLPAIFHCREAFNDLFAIADAEYPKGASAVLHCFTGTQIEAEKVLERGWMISLSGIITYKNAQALRDVARTIPLESILIETDSPFLAPQSKRGKVNEPSFIVETAQCLANLKGVSIQEIARATTANARKVFSL